MSQRGEVMQDQNYGDLGRKVSWEPSEQEPQEVFMNKIFIVVQSVLAAFLLLTILFFGWTNHNMRLSVDALRLARVVDRTWMGSDKMLERVRIIGDHKTIYVAMSYLGKVPANLSQNVIFPEIVENIKADTKRVFNKDLNVCVYICATDASNPVLFKDGVYTVVTFDHLKKNLKGD